ncbi:EAL domain-containing protein [Piscinibacter sp. HJYY11]|uniref:two-component system response regulator n=1 Tax=Piscinibacter sp. HJYY11 TaxID=2801333 RepID=UPI00191D4D68|nr:EAL domain-containing protein [Piscinibacter sp. HJYY11]MBL0728742.1 EAL domain-containing protein [Piscinibacter sp. HJYY11]
MHRLLLVESSPSLRCGLEKLLLRHGFAVVALPADATALAAFDQELSRGLATLILGWSNMPAAVAEAFVQRLGKPDCAPLALVVLAADPARVGAPLSGRAYTRVLRLQRPSEVPRLVRSLIAQVASDGRPDAESPSALKVLLVDDSRTSRTKYQRLLRNHGYAVVACEHAEAALERVQAERFDLAVIDYFMPGMNGAALCRALRELPATRDMTLAVLTGSYEEGLISDCLEAGASECMFKNESDELVVARVDSMARLCERERRLKDEGQRLELILSSVGDGVYGVDRHGRITFVNPAALRLLQCTHEDELVGLAAHERIHHTDERGRPVPAETCFLQQAYELGDSLSNWETVFWRADGEMLNVECTVRPQHQGDECVGVVVAFRDIAERKRHEAETQWQLRHDHLTKLHNRRHFEYMLEQEIFRLRRSSEQSALLFIDLDRFKQINDTAGHAAGDALLASIGRKLKSRSRQSDLVARLAGDEFAVLLRNVDDGSVLALAEKFRAILDEGHFSHGGREFEVSGSLGIARLSRHTLSPAYAMNCADAACHIAKREGRNRIHVFDLGGDAGALATLQQSWSERLKIALAAGNFALQFQPIFELRRLPEGGEEVTAEALHGHEVFLRLDDVDTLLAPRAFLSQAERFELMPALDGWVLDRVALMLAHRERPVASRFHLNVATASLLDAGYLARLTALLREGAFAPGQLCLEIKESELAGQLQALQPILNELHQLGVRLLLDEYGRGLGGLGHLRGLPLSAVKLDGSLVQSLASDEVGVLMVRAMTDLAHAMKAVVIAPLIEDSTVLQRLRSAGVDYAQGFVLGEPRTSWQELQAH